ncbi:MAG: formyltransferase family protein [Thermomicrobiales bacterium]
MTVGVNKRDNKRVVLFGMECGFTAHFLEALLAAQSAEVVGIVVPGTESGLASEVSRSMLADLAPHASVVEAPERSALSTQTFLSILARLDSDFIAVACFPWRIPAPVRVLPRHASINVHPSLLPEGRGPEPIFWAFRRDLRVTGVTLHHMDDGLDTGPIIAQRSVPIPTDATMASLERTLAIVGADMLGDVLSLRSHMVTSRAQPMTGGRPAPFPGIDDLIVTTSWEATAAARFINAVGPVFGPIEVLVLANGQRLAVAEVLGVEQSASTNTPVLVHQDEGWVRFASGVLHCRLVSVSGSLTIKM